ncbi:MAG: hypothetical protein P0Y51_21240 [Candidatus Pseudomonas colombiensis]|nr:MAG: hypothetical protein P0Y51_21240 [Pseudomonas sp.]
MKKLALVLVSGLASFAAVAQENLTVVTYGGSVAAAQLQSSIKPYADKTGVKVRTEDYSGGIAQLKAQVESKKVAWDVIDMEMPDAVRACNAGPVGAYQPGERPGARP